MKTPVLIAAKNEAHIIGKALSHLPDIIEPIVIPNGCEDNTAGIAENIGATVLHGSPEGKLPALQYGMEYLGKRALEPFFMLDADSYPALPKSWFKRMMKTIEGESIEQPSLTIGPYIFAGTNPLHSAWRNLGNTRALLRTRDDDTKGICGRNFLIHLASNDNLERILSMEHFWPREDVAIRDQVAAAGGIIRKVLHPAASVMTDGARFPSIRDRVQLGKEVSANLVKQSYLDEAAPGSVPYLLSADTAEIAIYKDSNSG